MDAPVPFIDYQDVEPLWHYLRDSHLYGLPGEWQQKSEKFVRQFERYLREYKALTATHRLDLEEYPLQPDGWSLAAPDMLLDIYTRMERSLQAVGQNPTGEFYLLILNIAFLVALQMRSDVEFAINAFNTFARSCQNFEKILDNFEGQLYPLPDQWHREDASDAVQLVSAAFRAVRKMSKDVPSDFYRMAIRYMLLAARYENDTNLYFCRCHNIVEKGADEMEDDWDYPRLSSPTTESRSQG